MVKEDFSLFILNDFTGSLYLQAAFSFAY